MTRAKSQQTDQATLVGFRELTSTADRLKERVRGSALVVVVSPSTY